MADESEVPKPPTEEERQAAEWQAFHERAAADGILPARPVSSDEQWLDAGVSLITGADAKPLAAMLRDAVQNKKPIPVSTIDMLAELLDPPVGDPLGCKFKLVKKRETVEDFMQNSNMVAEYEKQYKAANEADEIRPHEVAKDYAAQKFGKSESTIDRARRAHASLLKWLRGDF
jgi:hypothetical protein